MSVREAPAATAEPPPTKQGRAQWWSPVRRTSDRRAPGATARRGRRQGGKWVPWLFLAPALILFTYFKFIPMARALVMSAQDVRPYLGNTWVGGANYSEILGSESFRSALKNTVVLAIGQTFGS